MYQVIKQTQQSSNNQQYTDFRGLDVPQPLPTTGHGHFRRHSGTLNPVNCWDTLLFVLLKILKAFYFHPPAAGCKQACWPRHQVEDTSMPQETLKGPCAWLQPIQLCQGPVQPAQGPGRRPTDSRLQNQADRPQSWLWNLKQPWG